TRVLLLQSMPDEPDRAGKDKPDDHEIELVEDAAQPRIGAPLVAELHADPGEAEAPGPGADEGVEVEAQQRHPRDPGGKGDERPDRGQQPADQHGQVAPAVEEIFGAVEILVAHQEIAAPAVDNGAAAALAQLIGEYRSDIATDRARGRRPV